MIDAVYKDLISNILDQGYRYEDPNRKGVVRTEIPSYTFRHNFSDGFPAISLKKLAWKSVVTELIFFLKGDTNIKYLVDNGCNIWNKDAYNYFWKTVSNYTSPVEYDEFIRMIKTYNLDQLPIFPCGYRHGDLGPVYSAQWRNFNGVDQISNLIKNLKERPLATDHIVNSWNVGDLNKMALPPCHDYFQIVVRPLNQQERVNLVINENVSNMYKETTVEYLDSHNVPKYGFELHWHQRSVDTFLG